ncbi:hypothetical protein [Magnetospirillum molischianum]|uniref:Uncharacterized protein n=1 Tax=Magnetospirillum molischianum DSM 120 TaxID=1150626 RepID=H8FP26_MAGML|nr:hypothetical protein [Magnetospirillum molischianum]CCG40114.1 hypothetical protein PHAMO_180083 [Magnetospirillum molischianum DSM 120]
MNPIPLDTTVIVSVPGEYSGPAVVRNVTRRISGSIIAYRVETSDGDSIVVWPEEIVTSPSVVSLRHPVSSFQPEDLPPCA